MSASLTITLAGIQYEIIRWVYPLFLIFGITGCLLNIIVFSRKSLRKTSCSIYFFAASVDHLLTLIIGIGPVVYSINNPDPQIQSLIFCKLRGYIFQITLMLSRWYVAFACIDRYALSSEQVRLRNFANSKIAYRIVIVVILFWCLICSHRLIFYEIKDQFCGIVSSMVAALVHSAYVIIGGGILPAVIMIICACLIRKNLAEKHKRRTHLGVSQSHQQHRTIDNQILKILFIQIIFYIIFIIPQLCNLVFNTISITLPNRSTEYLAVENFVSFIAECILYMFPVSSFYLYTLTSKTFRKELGKCFRSFMTVCHVRIRVDPMANSTTEGYQMQLQH